MTDKPTILVVDDDDFMRMMIADAISEQYRVIDVSGGTECLETAAREKPDVILLDVEMPSMDGYAVCRRLKEDFELDSIPVVFISSHDEIEARLRGYEAGAEDYLVKPFEPQELLIKISSLIGKLSQQSQLKEMANYASQTAMTAMSSMSEMGSLLQTLQVFNSCPNMDALIEATMGSLAAYGLTGVVQIRHPQGALTRTSHGEASPLEASVISHMAGMERIVQFRSRLSITYPQVSLLVNNMPVEDPDRCGRLRDHLAVLVESAEVRVTALLADEKARQRAERIAASVQHITRALTEIDEDLRRTRVATGVAVQELTTQLERSYVQLALTESQEEFMAGIVSTSVAAILDAQLAESSHQDKMTAIVRELQDMLKS